MYVVGWEVELNPQQTCDKGIGERALTVSPLAESIKAISQKSLSNQAVKTFLCGLKILQIGYDHR